ncbi:hypothetical protein RCG24_15395 [Neobacillus sp. OS1-32]|jgi:hypothetical protein|nr:MULTISPECIES: hypothetical protein [Neobacillus]WML29342.1 hypothetical protein RCG24_15395 [Neobacillus sp. OS1-32]
MKKLYLSTLTLTQSIALFGCTNSTEIVKNTKEDHYKQKIIIMGSVNDPLPQEAKNVEYMPSNLEPQQIPNFNLKEPIIMTRMPYYEKKNSDNSPSNINRR